MMIRVGPMCLASAQSVLKPARRQEEGAGRDDDDRQLQNESHCALPYGIGSGPGRGATPQIAGEQGGRGGVWMRNSFPWVDAEPPFRHVPVNVFLSGNGVVKPSVSVCMNVTIRSSS